MKRAVCLHGHFYQPPRENPWIEEVEVQDSAAPFHDWNERIAAECYGPNGAARLKAQGGRICDIVNNYVHLSFNFGPTLLAWLERQAPEVYRAVLDADVRSVQERGHGNAIAQGYNHAILPLCNERDLRTQIRWGIGDFRHRFRREPEGMWLPETAADLRTLQALHEEGIRFTVLSPYQCRRVRAPGGDWVDAAGARFDPTRPYLIPLRSGAHLPVFFYDGPIARAVAFGEALGSGESASRSSTCWAFRSSQVMNMSSPRSVLTTTIDAAIVIRSPWKVCRRYSSQQVSQSIPVTPRARSPSKYSVRTSSSSWARRSSAERPPPTK
jgi:alpha-amylase/alpha-mannosidase (GH57 family)